MALKRIVQHGVFHITTKSQFKNPWMLVPGIFRLILQSMDTTAKKQQAGIIRWSVLPNHIHLIIKTGNEPLSRFVGSWKRNASVRINSYFHGNRNTVLSQLNILTPAFYEFLMHEEQETFIDVPILLEKLKNVPSTKHLPYHAHEIIGWQKSFHDEQITSQKQLQNTIEYIDANSVKHKLVERADEWPWSSYSIDPRSGASNVI